MFSVKTPGEAAAAPVPARRPRGLVPEIVATLEADIRAGRLQVGDKLPTESALVERFEVSRTVVREAISRLQASGLVETRHGIGTFVRQASAPEPTFRIPPQDLATAADVIALLELRISLESEAASLAAQRRDDSHLAAMLAALSAFEAAIRADSDAVPSDFQFHVEVARATGNRYYADLMAYLGTMIIPRTRLRTAGDAPEGRLAYLQRVHHEHESIYFAIRDRDAEAARAAMRTHLSNSRERLRRAQAAEAQRA
ncbi:FadR/GntR family transcriptional regulator [Hydrogenophaga sp.]|uniref:FadR/GntR family transcriptional regulator n=1 Tax=Hydrogenophaga sp. TaxID=1904254 RepID=UPI0035AFDED8